jgi:hypothetical protein
MEIVNFGHFTSYSQGDGILYFKNEDDQDWYDLRFGLTTWDDKGTFVDAIYGAWAMVDPSTMCITNVEFDPSRLMPGDRIVLGIDADWTTIFKGKLYEDGVLKDPPTPPIDYQPLLPVDFKLGMMRLNITPDMVDAVIGALPEPDRTIANIYWTSADRFKRDNPLIDQIAAAFGRTPEEVDTVWLQTQETISESAAAA